VYERRHRYTPTELYRRMLFDEPPKLSALNLGMLKAWKAFHTERERVRMEISPDVCSWEESKECQKKLFEMDVVWLDFLRTVSNFHLTTPQRRSRTWAS
jgi:hypothetical protein